MHAILKAILFMLILLSGAVARGPITRLRAEAKIGIAAAQNELGERYLRGKGVPIDYVEAEKWYLKAANQGYAPAQLNLGRLYDPEHRTPLPRRVDGRITYDIGLYDVESEKWLRLAAEQGLPEGQFALADLYMSGWGHHPGDRHEEIKKWLIRASEQGHATAQFELGNYYYFGPEVGRDNVRAYMWLTISASNGFQSAVSMRDYGAKKKNMTSAEIEKAKKLARHWRPKKSR